MCSISAQNGQKGEYSYQFFFHSDDGIAMLLKSYQWNCILKLSCIHYYSFITHELWVSIITVVIPQCALKPVLYWECYYMSRVQRVCGLQIYSRQDGEMFQNGCAYVQYRLQTTSPTYWQPSDNNILQIIMIINHIDHWWIHAHCAAKGPVNGYQARTKPLSCINIWKPLPASFTCKM